RRNPNVIETAIRVRGRTEGHGDVWTCMTIVGWSHEGPATVHGAVQVDLHEVDARIRSLRIDRPTPDVDVGPDGDLRRVQWAVEGDLGCRAGDPLACAGGPGVDHPLRRSLGCRLGQRGTGRRHGGQRRERASHESHCGTRTLDEQREPPQRKTLPAVSHVAINTASAVKGSNPSCDTGRIAESSDLKASRRGYPMRLENQVVIVTGGGLGIGRAYAERLGQEGARVAVVDIDAGAAEEVADGLRRAEADAIAVRTDVTDARATEEMATAVLERWGRIDALVNNAGMYQRPAVTRGPFEEIPIDEWDRVMAVNLRGVFLCARAVVPSMKRQRRGKIVNISSSTVFSGTPRFAHYVTSKAGVIGLTRVLAKELGEWNITVNAIAPGLTESMDLHDDALIQYHENRAQSRAIKRLEQPSDLVGAVAFLCSPDSDFITGQTLVVDGGSSLN